MKKVFGEIDLSGNLRLIEGKTEKKTNLKDFDKQERLIAALTSSRTIDRVYRFPRIKGKQLDLALRQKLIKDLEYIADINELQFVFSTYPVKDGVQVLVSLIQRDLLDEFKEFKALTFSSQVIAKFIHQQKINGTFLLIHVFEDDFITLVFKEGTVDYVRTFTTGESVDGAIELTKEYYKEQKKTEIGEIFFSGISSLNSSFEVKPISSLVKKGVKNVEFFVPFALKRTAPPFLYQRKALKPEHFLISASVISIILTGNLISINNNLSSEIERLKLQSDKLENLIAEAESSLTKIEKSLKEKRKFLESPRVRYIQNLKRPSFQEFLSSLEQLNLLNTYILSFNLENDQCRLLLITLNSETQTDVKQILNLLQKNRYISKVKLLNVKENDSNYVSLFQIGLKRLNYELPSK